MGWIKDKGSNKFQLGGQVPEVPQGRIYKKGKKVKDETIAERNKRIREEHKKSVADKAAAGRDRRDARKGRRRWKKHPHLMGPPELPEDEGRD